MARILVIDDDPGYRSALKRALKLEGHEVRTAPDGAAGLDQFRSEPADLVIIDLLMPEKEGLETIRELRDDNPDLPIIAISGAAVRGLGDLLRAAVLLGASRSMSKPFDDSELVALVRDVLGLEPQE